MPGRLLPLIIACALPLGSAAYAQDTVEDRFDALFGEDELPPCETLAEDDPLAKDCGPANATISSEGMGEAEEILSILDEAEEDEFTSDSAEEEKDTSPASEPAQNASPSNTNGSDAPSLADSASDMPPPPENTGDENTASGSGASTVDAANENSNAATPTPRPARFELVTLNAADDLAAVNAGYNDDGTFGSLAGVDTVPGTSEDALLDITLGEGLAPLADPLSPALEGVNDLGTAVGAPLGGALSPVLAPIADTLP